MTPGFRGSSSGIPASTLPTRSVPHVGPLRVDSAPDPREETHERGTEQDADHVEDVATERPVESDEFQERKTRDRHPGDAPAPERVAHRRPQVALHGVRGRPDVRSNADEHSDRPGESAPSNPEDESDREPRAVARDPEGESDDHRQRHRRGEDERVLAPQEGDRTLPDGRRDLAHSLVALVLAQDENGLDARVGEPDERGDQDEELELSGRQIHGFSARKMWRLKRAPN